MSRGRRARRPHDRRFPRVSGDEPMGEHGRGLFQ